MRPAGMGKGSVCGSVDSQSGLQSIENHPEVLEVLFCAMLTEPVAQIGFLILIDCPLLRNLLGPSSYRF